MATGLEAARWSRQQRTSPVTLGGNRACGRPVAPRGSRRGHRVVIDGGIYNNGRSSTRIADHLEIEPDADGAAAFTS